MPPNTEPRLPPVGRWVRLSRAAVVLGTTPDLVLSEIEAGGLKMRIARLGHRRIAHVAETDLKAAADLMARGIGGVR